MGKETTGSGPQGRRRGDVAQPSISRNYVYNLLMTGLNVAYPLIVFPYVSRVIGPDGVGRVNFAFSVVAYFAMFAAIGIPIYGIKEIARARNDRKELSRVFSELVTMNAVSAFIVTIGFVITLLSVPRLQQDWPVFIAVGSTIILNMFSLDWFYSGIENYRYISLRSGIFKAISLVLLLLFVRSRSSVLAYAIIGVTATAGSNLLNLLYSRRFVRIRLQGLNLRRHLKALILLFAASTVSGTYNSFDAVLLGFMQNSISVGLFSADRKITLFFLTVVGSLGTVLVPRLSFYVKHNLEAEYRTAAQTSINFLYFMSLPAIVLLEFYPTQVLGILGGSRFEPAALSLRLIAPQILFAALANFVGSQVLLAHSEEKKILLGNSTGAAVSLLLNVILIPRIDYNGAAISIVAAETAIFFVFIVLSRKHLSFKLFGREAFSYLIGAAIMAVICVATMYIQMESFLRFVVGTVVSLAAYLSYLYLRRDALLKLVLDRYLRRSQPVA